MKKTIISLFFLVGAFSVVSAGTVISGPRDADIHNGNKDTGPLYVDSSKNTSKLVTLKNQPENPPIYRTVYRNQYYTVRKPKIIWRTVTKYKTCP